MKRHLSEERLVELTLGTAAPNALAEAVADDHLAVCEICRTRALTLTHLLDDVAGVANAQADLQFSDERLARQQARILQRVEQDGRPGRLITFPAGQHPAPLSVRSRPASRWVATAAVAGLVIGLFTGQLLRTGQSTLSPAWMASSDAGSNAGIRPVSTTLSDAEFLGEIEAAGSLGPPSLRPLDALTPLAWEVTR